MATAPTATPVAAAAASPVGLPRRRAARAATARNRTRHPLHRDRERPRDAGEGRTVAHRQRDAQRGEPADERVVVPAAGEVDREHRVPGDERHRERRPCRCAGDRRGGNEHGGRREPLEEPGRGVGRGAGEERHGLREQGEHRAVDRRRVAPVGADVVGRGALREVRRGIDVRVAAAVARDPAVAPVRPRVGREEQRRRERDELDRRAEREHDADRRAAAHRDEAGEVRDERADQQDEERPRRPLGRVGAVGRHDGRAVPPRRGRRDGDEDERRRTAQHDGGPHGSRPGAYRSSLEPGPPAPGRAGVFPAGSFSSSGSGVAGGV